MPGVVGRVLPGLVQLGGRGAAARRNRGLSTSALQPVLQRNAAYAPVLSPDSPCSLQQGSRRRLACGPPVQARRRRGCPALASLGVLAADPAERLASQSRPRPPPPAPAESAAAGMPVPHSTRLRVLHGETRYRHRTRGRHGTVTQDIRVTCLVAVVPALLHTALRGAGPGQQKLSPHGAPGPRPTPPGLAEAQRRPRREAPETAEACRGARPVFNCRGANFENYC